MLGGYKNMQKKHGSAPNPGPLEPNNIKKITFLGPYFEVFWPFLGRFWADLAQILGERGAYDTLGGP